MARARRRARMRHRFVEVMYFERVFCTVGRVERAYKALALARMAPTVGSRVVADIVRFERMFGC